MRRIGSGHETSAPSGARLALLAAAWLASGVAVAQQDVEDEPPDLRERLTEREDEGRLEQPRSFEVLGRPLFLSGQFELALDHLRRAPFATGDGNGERLRLEPEVEAEAFYSFGRPLSLFVQLRVAMEQDLRDGDPDRLATRFVERGEMWVNSIDIGGSGVDAELGRLDFEDDRTWWWDADLDALRLSREGDRHEVAFAVAREWAPDRSDRSFIEPEHDGVRRWLLEASWDWAPEHSLHLFAVHHRDRSRTPVPGERVRGGREDDSDARLDWWGVRASGAWQSPSRGLFAYWIDLAQVRGEEQRIEWETGPDDASIVEDRHSVRVRGRAVDAGATWMLPLPHDPRLSAGLARTTGDRDSEDGVDRGFRQSGLQGNEIGFGGVQRFARYGELLDPELANLQVDTLGVGISLFQSSSLDLIHHRYRLAEPAGELRDARIDVELTGDSRDLGRAFDLVLALEEWRRFELELSGSAFRTGRAFGDDADAWTWGGFAALRIAF